jgi:integrase
MANIQTRPTASGGTRYRVQVRVKGFPPQIATFDRLSDAKRWAVQTEAALREGRHFKTAEAKRRTFSDLVERYKKIARLDRNRVQHLRWWESRLGRYSLADLTPSRIASLRDALAHGSTPSGRPAKPATVIRYLATLSHVFTYAEQELEWVDSHPVKKVRRPAEPGGRVRFLDEDERGRLLEACRQSGDPRLYPLVVLALSTGGRQGELLGLRWRDVDLDRKVATLHQTKNGERRALPLSGLAFDLLCDLSSTVQHQGADYVFADARGRAEFPRTEWENALARAEVGDFRFHDLRHSAASYLAMNGATLAEIAEILGHKTLAMVKRYAHLSHQHVASVVERMNARIFR